jgi:hypothetical protein
MLLDLRKKKDFELTKTKAARPAVPILMGVSKDHFAGVTANFKVRTRAMRHPSIHRYEATLPAVALSYGGHSRTSGIAKRNTYKKIN